MQHKKMFVGALVAASFCLAGVVQAKEQERVVDRDAAAMCGQLGDASRVEACLQQLPTLAPAQARAQALLEDPAVQASVEAWGSGLETAMAARAQELAAQGDVRSLLGAMLVMPTRFNSTGPAPGKLGPQERDWFARARQLGPTDPLVAWVEMFDCYALDCDRDATLEHLRHVDGDNAAVHLWAIHDEALSSDTGAARGQLRRAASASRFDSYSSQLLHLLLEARSGARLPPMDARVATVLTGTAASSTPADVLAMQSIAQWAAITMAPLRAIALLCRPDSAELIGDPELRRDCIAVLSMLADDDALIYAHLATRVLTKLDPARADKWVSRMRQLAWWQDQSAQLMSDGNLSVPTAEYAAWIANDGELAALPRLLERAGVSAEPPADWALPGYLR